MGARLRTALVGACFAALMLVASPAHAAFPGANGKIAFASPHGIETIQPDGSGRTLIGSGDDPAWSPDGRRIAFTTGGGLAVMNADGTGRNVIFPGDVSSPAWSPDGSRIVFVQTFQTCDPDTCQLNDDLYIVRADGTNPVALTSTPAASESEPAWSPDGAEIAFAGNGLETIRPDGTGRTQITPCCPVSPDWSPDGNRIAYASSTLGQPAEIHTINADGSNDAQLTKNAVTDGAPAWSPDGRKIAFYRHSAEVFRPGADIWTINADGTGELKLTVDGNQQDHTNLTPDWQPLNRPPECSNVTATPDTLWPPNNRFVPVSLSGASDADGDPVMITITGVTQDEPTRRSPDAKLGPASDQLKLRAKRSSRGDGRVYRIAFKASDGRGACSGTATVSVPRKKRKPAADSAPPSYDSFGR